MLKKTLIITTAICAIASLSISQTAYAQINEIKLFPFIGAAGDAFGESVSISGDYVIVGAQGDDENGANSGSAHVFKRTGASWTQEAILLASDGALGDGFGGSVSISGDYAVVGASGNDDNGDRSGSAYVFHRTGTSWAQEAKLLPNDGTADDRFGASVSISGDYVIVGAFLDDEKGSYFGSAYVFSRTGTTWTQEVKLLPPDGAAEFNFFGMSVSISGDYAVVGAQGDDPDNSGSAYVYKRTGPFWAQETKLLPFDADSPINFGGSVSISGDYVVVGGPGDDGRAGSAYFFKRTGTSWTQETRILASDGAAWDRFGNSVSISGDYAVVGAWFHDDNGDNSGSAYLFKRTGSFWTQEAKLLPSDGAAGDIFGWSVSISGGYAIVGAYENDDNGTDAGAAYMYSGFTPPVGVEDEITGLPAEFALSQNYPNPFNPETVIEFALPQSEAVSLVVYNLHGEEVALLFGGTMPAGVHKVSWDASSVASGVYLYMLQAGEFVETKKMLLLK